MGEDKRRVSRRPRPVPSHRRRKLLRPTAATVASSAEACQSADVRKRLDPLPHMREERQDVGAPDARIVESIGARIPMRQVSAAAQLTLRTAGTRPRQWEAFFDSLMDQRQALRKVFESGPQHVETTGCDSIVANAQRVESFYRAVG